MRANPNPRGSTDAIPVRLPRPSLKALRAFEATARLRSFSAAALELSVTHGAVSRHIRALEDTIGLSLLHRRANGGAWDDWARECRNVKGPLQVHESFAHFYLLIQAAKCGLGLANVPRRLVRDDLSSGTLVAPLGFVPGRNKISVWRAPHLGRRGDAVRLVDWLVDELRSPEQDPTAMSR